MTGVPAPPVVAEMAGVPLAAVVRSGLVESVHSGHLLLRDSSADVLVRGQVDAPIWPRSAAKPLQAVAMLRAGLRVDDEGLALAAASHEGTVAHRAVVLRVLAEAGLSVTDLQNTPDLPLGLDAASAWIAEGHGPSSLTQNCSGKHAAMLLTCVQAGWDPATYLDPAHPLQRLVRETVAELSGTRVERVGVDGCGAPLFATTLRGLAHAFARIATGEPGGPESRVAGAVAAHPALVGGPHRDVTAVLRAVPGLLAKDGADGVFAAALPDGSCLAVKIADGGARPVRAVVADALMRIVPAAQHPALHELGRTDVLGHGVPVGQVLSLLPAVEPVGPAR